MTWTQADIDALSKANPDLRQVANVPGDFATEEDLLNAQERLRAMVLARNGTTKGKAVPVERKPRDKAPQGRKAPATLADIMSEAQLQDSVIALARTLGWRVAHFRPARTEAGWRTAVSADGAGFPDLVMLRANRLLVVELKSEGGKLTPVQALWLGAFVLIQGCEQALWRPSDWLSGHIEEVLR